MQQPPSRFLFLATEMGASRLLCVICRFLVETLLEMHLEGFTLADMEVMLSMARLESGGKLVEPLEQEILLSWCAMVMLTLETVGLPRRPYAVRSFSCFPCSIGRVWHVWCGGSLYSSLRKMSALGKALPEHCSDSCVWHLPCCSYKSCVSAHNLLAHVGLNTKAS